MMTDVTRHALGELCLGGDWACTNGDLETLGYVAGRLATCTNEPLCRELTTLAEMCRCDLDGAIAAWLRLKQRVLQEDGRPIGMQ